MSEWVNKWMIICKCLIALRPMEAWLWRPKVTVSQSLNWLWSTCLYCKTKTEWHYGGKVSITFGIFGVLNSSLVIFIISWWIKMPIFIIYFFFLLFDILFIDLFGKCNSLPFLHMQGLPGRPGEKGSPGEPVSTENSREQLVLSVPLIVINYCIKYEIFIK